MEKNYMTPNGKKQLEAELKKILQNDRPASMAAIDEALGHGDIRENAEYHAAKERQSYIEARIAEIKHKLAGVEIIDPATVQAKTVAFGATVTIEDHDTGHTKTYHIVGEDESDIKRGKLSYLSPMARLMIGKNAGEDFELKNDKVHKSFTIVSFCYGNHENGAC